MQWQPDWGLRGRMVVTMFLLFTLYIVFVGVLASAGVGLVGIIVVMGLFSVGQLFFSDKLALRSMGGEDGRRERVPRTPPERLPAVPAGRPPETRHCGR